MNLGNYTTEELWGLLEDIKKEIKKREFEQAQLIEINWSGACEPRKQGKPYLAILTAGSDGKKFNYQFLPCVEEHNKKTRLVKATYQGSLKVGTILRGREGGSWNRDHSYYYCVTKEGLIEITESEALKALGILK